MKLLSCHIENFGKLSGLDLSFDPGLNVILRENGWGKSTLASFILAMFYGLSEDEEGKNEHERFYPWQGGRFGGSLRFISGNKSYEITRNFGKSAAEDSASLKDLSTGKTMPMAENLGEKLFSIDKASFKRTVFMGQNDDSSAGTSADITKKISNLTNNLASIHSYEEAAEKIRRALEVTDRENGLSPDRLQEEIDTLTEEVARLQKEEQLLFEDEEELKEVRRAVLQEKRKQEELKRSQSEAIRLQEIAREKEEYRRLLSEKERADLRFSEVAARFPKGLPEEADLEEALTASREQLRAASGRPKEALTEEQQEEVRTLSERFPGAEAPAAAVLSIARAERLNERRKSLKEKKEELASLPEEVTKEKKKHSPLMLIIGIIVLVLGLDLAFYGYFSMPLILYAGIGISVIGLALLIAGIVLFTRKSSPAVTEEQARRARLRLEMENDTAVIADEEEALKNFFHTRGIEVEKGEEEAAARGMLSDVTRLQELQELERKVNEEEARKRQNLSDTVNGFLQRYGFGQPENAISRIFEVQNDKERYEIALADKEKADNACSAFEEDVNVERILNTDTEEIPGLNELLQKQQDAELKFSEAAEKEKQLEMNILTRSRSAEEKAEKDAALSAAKAALQEAEDRKRLLEKTGGYLRASRQAQSDRFMEPILSGFRTYYGLLSGLGAEDYRIDEHAGVQKEELGEAREASSLSTAYRDLVGVALRLSLVDAMYTQEKPFLVMDDPFVNFDLKKTEEGRKFLKAVAEKYQIVYFTCHESRA